MDINFESELSKILEEYRNSGNSDELIKFLKSQMNQGTNGFNASSRISDRDFSSFYNQYANRDDLLRQRKSITKELAELEERLQELLNEGFTESSEEVIETRKEIDKLTNSLRNVNLEINDRGKVSSFFDNLKAGADRFNGSINGIVHSVEQMYGAVNTLVDSWAKADKAASDYAKTIATSRAGREALRAQTISNVHDNKIAASLDLSTEEIIEAQLEYSKGIGRNARISDEGQATLGAMTKVYGGAAKDLSVLFEKFGVGPIDTGKHLGKMFSEASKSGLSLEKYADNVNKGLRLAQRYTFSGGLKGMEAMAKKATELHMDMQQIETLANKVGTIEGSITTAAKVQVLGGPFASMADPMGMFSEAWGDIEGLTKRMEKFTETMGHFNRRTGEVEISSFNKQRLRAFAEATGQDYNQVMEQTQQQAKLGEVKSQMARSANSSLWANDEKLQELIRNTATFENGKAGVSINGQFQSIDTLSSDDLDKLREETQSESEDIKEIASMLRDYFQVESSRKKARDAQRAKWVEKLGIGNGMKSLNDVIAHSNILLTILNATLIAQSGARFISGLGGLIGSRGVGGMVTRGVRRFTGGLGTGGRVGNAISGLAGKKTIQTATGKQFTKVGGRVFNAQGKELFDAAKQSVLNSSKSLGSNAGKTALRETRGRFGANSITKVNNLGTKLSNRGFTKTGGLLTKHASNQATKFGMNNVTKMGGKKIATKTATKIGTKMTAGIVKGGVAGIVGAAGNVATDMLVDSGKIQKGGAGHTAMKVGSTTLEGAALGATIGSIFPGIGTAVGAAIGAIGGAVVGGVKMAKVKREMALDNKLKTLGVERQGNYGARGLNKIDKALTTGKISKRLRRKMEKEGDIALLNEIDKAGEVKKKEKEAKREQRRKNRLEFINAIKPNGDLGDKLRNASFEVQVANFNGKAFNGIVGKSNLSRFGLNIGPRLNNLRQRTVGSLGGLNLKFGKNIGQNFIKPFSLTPISNIIINRGKLEDGNSPQLQELRQIGAKETVTQTQQFKMEPINININGTLKLESNNSSQSVDIMSEIVNNRELKKKLAEIIANELNSYKFGGNKVIRTGGIQI